MGEKKKENRLLFKVGLTEVIVIITGLLCYFLLFHIQSIASTFANIVNLLLPFLYGVCWPICWPRFAGALKSC